MEITNQLFDWEESDDEFAMIYYNITLKQDIGEHTKGTKFDQAYIDWEEGKLVLSQTNMDRHPAIKDYSYQLLLSIQETH